MVFLLIPVKTNNKKIRTHIKKQSKQEKETKQQQQKTKTKHKY